MGINLFHYRSEDSLSSSARKAVYSWVTPSNFLIAAIFFSVASLFPVELEGLPIFKLLAFACVMAAAVASARMNDCDFFTYAVGAAIAVVLFFSGAILQWDNLKGWELWLIKPLMFIPMMAVAVSLLVTFDYSNTKFQNGLATIMVLLMITLFAQAALLLTNKDLFDFQAALGLPKTRTHHRLYSFDSYVDVYRLSGIAVEPAVYCTTMFCLLLMCRPNINSAIRIPAEVSIGLCLSALGWIMLGLIWYRNFLLMPINRSLKSLAITISTLILGLVLIYPVDASWITLQRIVCSQADPSANARLFAFLPENIPTVDFGICPPTSNVPSREAILNEATTDHQRGSNFMFIASAFGVPGFIVFFACISSLIALSRKFLSFPIFLFSLLMSALTEPIFWLGFLGCALLIRHTALKQIKPNAAIT